jgi:hypothetical protein
MLTVYTGSIMVTSGSFGFRNWVDITSGSITITKATGSESASHTTLTQYVRSTAGTIKGNTGFGIRNEFYGTNNDFYPIPFGAVEYTVASKPALFSTIQTNYIGYSGNHIKMSEYGVNSIKEFPYFNNNYVHREYVMVGTTTGTQNVYLSLAAGPPFEDFIDMPNEESWNFTVRVIARRTDNIASDAFFINGYCDNTGVGTIVGQGIIENEVGAAALIPVLNVAMVFDQADPFANPVNYFRVQCQSNVGGGAIIQWIGFVDIVANNIEAGPRDNNGMP